MAAALRMEKGVSAKCPNYLPVVIFANEDLDRQVFRIMLWVG
jgi:hypothetical protein